MKQDDVAGKILIELLELKVIEEKDEQVVYEYLERAYAAGHDYGRSQIKHRQPVAQYDTNGTLLRIWDSASVAGKSLRISSGSISDVVNGAIRGKRKTPKLTAGGFMWRKVNGKLPIGVEEKIGSIQVKSNRQVPKTHASKTFPLSQ